MTAADPREDARHRRADAFARQADALAHIGDLARARDLYGQAGDLAAAVARACAPGIDSLGPFIAARAVTLWFNAGRFADARDLALACLRGPRSLRPTAPPGVAGPRPDRRGHDGGGVRSPRSVHSWAWGSRSSRTASAS